jgi:hypothetical protein
MSIARKGGPGETIFERVGALDVHKAQVTACVRVPAPGGRREQHVAEFATGTKETAASTGDALILDHSPRVSPPAGTEANPDRLPGRVRWCPHNSRHRSALKRV